MNLQVGSGLGVWVEGLGAVGFRGLGFRVQDVGVFFILTAFLSACMEFALGSQQGTLQ